MATHTETPDCPRCGASLPPAQEQREEAALHICGHCNTVVISSQQGLKAAGRHSPEGEAVDWLHALGCRLCGAALSETAARTPKQARCEYCGHKALLRPGVLAVLRALLRDPKLVPASLRNMVLSVLFILASTIGLSAAGVLLQAGETQLAQIRVVPATAARGDVLYDQVIDLPGFVKRVNVTPQTESASSLSLDADFVHLSSQSCQSQSVRNRHDSTLDGEIPSGETRVLVTVSALHSRSKVAEEFTVDLTIYQQFSLGYLIFGLMIVSWLWLAITVLRIDFQSSKRRGARATQGITLLFLLFYASVTVLGIDPLRARSLDPDHSLSFTPMGASCDRMTKAAQSNAANPELASTMDQAIALSRTLRAEEWEGLASAGEQFDSPPSDTICIADLSFVMSRHEISTAVDQIGLQDFVNSKNSWRASMTERMEFLRDLAWYRGRFDKDQESAASSEEAASYRERGYWPPHVTILIEDRGATTADLPSNVGRGHVFVWDYEEARIVCASPIQVSLDAAAEGDADPSLRFRAILTSDEIRSWMGGLRDVPAAQ